MVSQGHGDPAARPEELDQPARGKGMPLGFLDHLFRQRASYVLKRLAKLNTRRCRDRLSWRSVPAAAVAVAVGKVESVVNLLNGPGSAPTPCSTTGPGRVTLRFMGRSRGARHRQPAAVWSPGALSRSSVGVLLYTQPVSAPFGAGRVIARDQLVPQAGYGLKDPTLLIPHLLAQAVGVDVDVVGLGAVARTPARRGGSCGGCTPCQRGGQDTPGARTPSP